MTDNLTTQLADTLRSMRCEVLSVLVCILGLVSLTAEAQNGAGLVLPNFQRVLADETGQGGPQADSLAQTARQNCDKLVSALQSAQQSRILDWGVLLSINDSSESLVNNTTTSIGKSTVELKTSIVAAPDPTTLPERSAAERQANEAIIRTATKKQAVDHSLDEIRICLVNVMREAAKLQDLVSQGDATIPASDVARLTDVDLVEMLNPDTRKRYVDKQWISPARGQVLDQVAPIDDKCEDIGYYVGMAVNSQVSILCGPPYHTNKKWRDVCTRVADDNISNLRARYAERVKTWNRANSPWMWIKRVSLMQNYIYLAFEQTVSGKGRQLVPACRP